MFLSFFLNERKSRGHQNHKWRCQPASNTIYLFHLINAQMKNAIGGGGPRAIIIIMYVSCTIQFIYPFNCTSSLHQRAFLIAQPQLVQSGIPRIWPDNMVRAGLELDSKYRQRMDSLFVVNCGPPKAIWSDSGRWQILILTMDHKLTETSLWLDEGITINTYLDTVDPCRICLFIGETRNWLCNPCSIHPSVLLPIVKNQSSGVNLYIDSGTI